MRVHAQRSEDNLSLHQPPCLRQGFIVSSAHARHLVHKLPEMLGSLSHLITGTLGLKMLPHSPLCGIQTQVLMLAWFYPLHHLPSHLFIHVFIFEAVLLCSLCWPETHYLVQTSFELVANLLPFECWNYRCKLPHTVKEPRWRRAAIFHQRTANAT